jgi:transposase
MLSVQSLFIIRPLVARHILLFPDNLGKRNTYDFPCASGTSAQRKTTIAKPLVSDALWSRIARLLPPFHSPGLTGGRPRINDRAVLTGILFILKSGIPWEMRPEEMNCGSGMTCWRRLRDWQTADVWDKLQAAVLSELRGADMIDWSRASVDFSSIRAVGGGEASGPNPTDRARPGTKHHVMVDGQGVPLAVSITGANTPDVQQLLPLVVAIPQVRGKSGHPKSRPKALYAGRAYDSEPARAILRWLEITPFLAKRVVKHGSGSKNSVG